MSPGPTPEGNAMRKWLYDNPWIWVALFLSSVVAASSVVLVIAEIHKPEIVKVKPGAQTRGHEVDADVRIV